MDPFVVEAGNGGAASVVLAVGDALRDALVWPGSADARAVRSVTVGCRIATVQVLCQSCAVRENDS